MTQAVRDKFTERLLEVCADKGLPAGHGLQSRLAKQFGVTSNAARKWLLSEGLPELALAIKIADWGDVNVLWLLQGAGPKSRQAQSAGADTVHGAFELLPPRDAAQAIDFLRYKLDRCRSVIVDSRLAKYMEALDRILDRLNQPPPPTR
jgi:transcriptional regulator with XRE-family HTH domain